MTEMISLPDGTKIRHLSCQEILRIEAAGSYAIIHFISREPFKCAKLLKEIIKKLNSKYFIKIHKSHVVNLKEVKEYERGRGGKVLMSDGSFVCVSVRKKCELLRRLG